jgi:hypothetical protein
MMILARNRTLAAGCTWSLITSSYGEPPPVCCSHLLSRTPVLCTQLIDDNITSHFLGYGPQGPR